MRKDKGSPNKVVYKVNKTTGKLLYASETNALDSYTSKLYASDDYTSDLEPKQYFKIANFDTGTKDVALFKENVIACIKSAGYPAQRFFNNLNDLGLTIDRSNFLYKELKYYPRSLWLSTFARCLGISLHHLFDPSLPEKLKSGEVVVKIQFLPEQTGNK